MKKQETHLLLVLIDHRGVDVPVPRANRDLDLSRTPQSDSRPSLCSQLGTSRGSASINTLTAFSTSFGFESHVPRPIWGIFAPVESDKTLPKDIVLVLGSCATMRCREKQRGEMRGDSREMRAGFIPAGSAPFLAGYSTSLSPCLRGSLGPAVRAPGSLRGTTGKPLEAKSC